MTLKLVARLRRIGFSRSLSSTPAIVKPAMYHAITLAAPIGVGLPNGGRKSSATPIHIASPSASHS